MAATIKSAGAEYRIDEPIEVKLDGLPPHAKVTFRSSMVDQEGTQWASEAVFESDRSGRVDVGADMPVSGTWTGPDPDGFLWSMAPCTQEDFDSFRRNGRADIGNGVPSYHRFGRPTYLDAAAVEMDLQALVDGVVVASKRIVRHRFPPGLRETKVDAGSLRGVLFEPATPEPHPGVVILSGSEGGIKREVAALLAAHGFAAFALGYFAAPDLPRYHVRIPLEYFAEGIRWLRDYTGVERVGLYGGSRGGEAVLAIATHFPDLVNAVVAVVPGDLYAGSFAEDESIAPAWTLDGRDLPCAWDACNPRISDLFAGQQRLNTTQQLYSFFADTEIYERCAIPIERMRCPVLFISGPDDRVWPSHLASCRAVERLKAKGYGWPVEHLWMEDTGHGIGIPGSPTVMCDAALHPLIPIYISLGGKPRPTAQMQRVGWRRTVEFLALHLGGVGAQEVSGRARDTGRGRVEAT